MYNTAKPDDADLPSAKKLLRSTLLALAIAIVLLFTVVLPAEYAIDPTGIGRALGLTEMGEIKAQLAREAAADAAGGATLPAAAGGVADAPPVTAVVQAPAAGAVAAASGSDTAPPSRAGATPPWRDEMQVVLAPGQGAEIKLGMKAGEQAQFSWTVQDGAVNFDAHADGGGKSISYEKGRDARADEGVLEAAFDGNHGWFWRNRGTAPVTVVLRVRGQYSSIKRLV